MIRTCILACLCALVGCATVGRPEGGAAVLPSDLDALTGAPWVGTLTYLDYTSRKPVTIDSSLIVRRVGEGWEFGVGYSKEPHADSKEVVTLEAGMLGGDRVVSRASLPGGGVEFVTESQGEDDHRAALFRIEHSVTEHEYTRRKMVRFEGESEFFERHVYRWRR